MVNIDTVYQRVLILANKEQRGYITPQEFNLYANQAQMEIFEQYFYDLNQSLRNPGNNTTYADVDDMLEEKLQVFENTDESGIINLYPLTPDLNAVVIPDYIYRIIRIENNNNNCEILSTKDFNEANNGSYLIKPNFSRPIANIKNNSITISVGGVGGNVTIPTRISYFKIPYKVEWGYFVLNTKALYDSNPIKTKHFELHRSEETELVYKILKFAGVSMKRSDVIQAAQFAEQAQVQQEKQ